MECFSGRGTLVRGFRALGHYAHLAVRCEFNVSWSVAAWCVLADFATLEAVLRVHAGASL